MTAKPFRILIAPLNWGLGHATRCLPIASAFAKTGAAQARTVEIHWASDGQALELLRAELPAESIIHELPSYGIRYPTSSASVNMVLGGPQMATAIVREAKAVADLHEHFSYNFILSDNRFGCRIEGVPSAIMTHQVHLPIRNWFSRKLGNFLNYRLLAKFDQVVVPDVASSPRLAGDMSAAHPKTPTSYIGPISRFANRDGRATVGEKSIGMAVVLSGPEPQRTKLEMQLIQALAQLPLKEKIVLVRGLPQDAPKLNPKLLASLSTNRRLLEVYDYLGAEALLEVLAKAEIILTRPGYTTVMDLNALHRRAIYVPTPGQPEQNWLGKSLSIKGEGICVSQTELNLNEAIDQLRQLEVLSAASTSVGETLLDKWVMKVLRES